MNNNGTQQPERKVSGKKEYAFVQKLKTRKLRRKMKVKLLIVAVLVVAALSLLTFVMINISRTSKDKAI